MQNIIGLTGIVSDIKRLPSSYMGNPRYSFMIDGHTVTTAVDSMHGYGITNYENKQVIVTAGTHYNKLTLKFIEVSTMNSVEVMFNNPKYNYITSVSAQSSKQSCTDYFVGEAFNMGTYPKDDFQRCVDIKFVNNNEVTA